MKFSMIHHADQKTINEMYNQYEPVFILSTGRSGSKFLASLLEHSSNLASFHEPPPTLQYFSNYAYHHQGEKEILTQMMDAARMEGILDIFIKDKIYVESNQCLTFFAPVLASLFKKAKFVHIVRHPGAFVRSAVCKGWHKNDSIWESGRVKMAAEEQWQHLNHIQRLSWLWATTHGFIEDFQDQVGKERCAFFQLEELVTDVRAVQELLRFIGGVEIPTDIIQSMQASPVNELIIGPNEPSNIKKVPLFPGYSKWSSRDQENLRVYAAPLAALYHYPL